MSARRVLVVHAEQTVRQRVEQALVRHEVIGAATRREASALFPLAHLVAVVTTPTELRRLLRDVQRSAPGASCVVLTDHPEQTSTEMEALAASGWDFVSLPTDALSRLGELLEPRASSRKLAARALRGTFSAEGHVFAGRVLDVGSDGLSLILHAEAPLEQLEIGTQVSSCTVSDEHGLVLEPRTWVVRSEVRLETGETRIGFSIDPGAPRTTTSAVIDPPHLIRNRIRRALARDAHFLVHRRESPTQHRFTAGDLDAAGARLTVSCFDQAHSLEVGEAVQLAFELGGEVHHGHSSVLATSHNSAVLAVPTRLHRLHRRHSLRLQAASGLDAHIDFEAPLSGAVFRARLQDLEPRGAAFHYDVHRATFPPGLRLSQVAVSVGGQRFVGEATVRGTTPLEEHGQLRRCGVALTGFEAEAVQAIRDALMTANYPGAVSAHTERLEDIWQMLSAASAEFPDYPPVPGPHLAPVVSAHRLVGDGRHGLAKSVAWKDEGQLVGYVGGLRIYSGTWLPLHLAVRPGFRRQVHVSRSLVNLMVDYAETLEDIDFVRGLWRTANRWTSRIYGAIVGNLGKTGQVVSSSFRLLRRAVEGQAPVSAIPVSLAGSGDLDALLRELRLTKPATWLKANDFTAAELGLQSLKARYKGAGLHRARTVACARVDGRCRGWVIVEEMTPGLCWPELHQSYRLVIAEPGAPDADEVRRALIGWAHVTTASRGGLVLRAVCEPEDVAALVALDYQDLGEVAELTGQRSILREWNESMVQFFERAAAALPENRTHQP